MYLETVTKEIKKNGFYKVKNVLDIESVNKLNSELKNFFDLLETGDECNLSSRSVVEKNAYGYGKILRISKDSYNRFYELNKFVNIDWFDKLVDEYYGFCYNKKLQTFCTHDYISHEESSNPPRNSFLHVDPYQAIKFICYLSDTDENNGAFRCIPGTSNIGEKIRSEYSLQDLLNTTKYCFDESNKFFDSSMLKDLIYLDGKAGDVIIVNTDIIHGGGIIKNKNKFRKTVNLHNRKN